MSKYSFWLIALGTLIMLFVMARTGASLKTTATPKGILNLEFASTSGQTSEIMNAWKYNGEIDNIEVAKKNTYYDFLFIICYSLFLYRGCRNIAMSFSGWLQKLGLVISSGAIAAGILDVLENTGMLISLHGRISDTVSLFTVSCSVVKWLLAAAAFFYFVVMGIASLFKKSNPS